MGIDRCCNTYRIQVGLHRDAQKLQAKCLGFQNSGRWSWMPIRQLLDIWNCIHRGMSPFDPHSLFVISAFPFHRANPQDCANTISQSVRARRLGSTHSSHGQIPRISQRDFPDRHVYGTVHRSLRHMLVRRLDP